MPLLERADASVPVADEEGLSLQDGLSRAVLGQLPGEADAVGETMVGQVLECLPVGVFVLAANGEVVFANRMARSFYRLILHEDYGEAGDGAGGRLGSLFLGRDQSSWTLLLRETVYSVTVRPALADAHIITIQMVDALDAGREGSRPDFGVTSRELEVARLILAGRRNKEIAEELVISVNTVNNHVQSLLRKTGTRNRIAAASKALGHMT